MMTMKDGKGVEWMRVSDSEAMRTAYKRELAELHAELERAWLPIETAPINDGWFLARSDKMVHIVCRRSGNLFEVGVDPDEGEIGIFTPLFTFTGWMPLPRANR
jgi:hypothetical protein